MRRIIAASICLLFAGVGVASAQTPFKSDYYPLEIGHRWTYQAVDLKAAQPKADPKRKVVVEVDREEIYARSIVKDGKQVVEKNTGFILKSTSGGKTTLDHVIVLAEGIHRIHAAETPISPPLLFFKLPLKPGESWTCDSVSGNRTIKGTFTWKTESITVPLGKFDALLISFNNNKKGEDRVEIDYWFAQGVGMVKQRALAKNHEVLLELERFDKAK